MTTVTRNRRQDLWPQPWNRPDQGRRRARTAPFPTIPGLITCCEHSSSAASHGRERPVTQSVISSLRYSEEPTQIADSQEQNFGVHDVASLGVSARREPVLWSHVHDDGSTYYPFVAANLTFRGCHSYSVMDMSTTTICLHRKRSRMATPGRHRVRRLVAGHGDHSPAESWAPRMRPNCRRDPQRGAGPVRLSCGNMSDKHVRGPRSGAYVTALALVAGVCRRLATERNPVLASGWRLHIAPLSEEATTRCEFRSRCQHSLRIVASSADLACLSDQSSS